MNLAEEIFRHADSEAPALLWHEGKMTYSELDRRSRSIADALRKRFPTPGSRIGLRCPDGRDHVILSLGILRGGCCLVPLANELPPSERERVTGEISLAAVMIPEAGPESPGFALEPGGKPDPHLDRKLSGIDPAFIRFTSGTTGSSKGILLTHRSLADRIAAANSGLGIRASDRILWVLPMSHHFAVSILLYLRNGAAIVLPESLLPGDLLRAARDHDATVFYAAPFHYLLLVSGTEPSSVPENHPWPSLRLAVSTTAPLDAATARKFHAIHGVTPAQALGVMEVGLPLINLPWPELLPSSAGRPQAGFEAEIRDDDGLVCPPGKPGRLFLRGPGMFDAYVAPWRSREEATELGGWFATGDVAVIDDGGSVILQGRSVNVISVGGMKFFPEEVEKVLRMHPRIVEARIIATEHPALGAVPVAEVVLSAGPEVHRGELISLCRRELAPFKVPVTIRFLESLPKTPSGKIRRTPR